MLNTIKWNLLLGLALLTVTTVLHGQDVRERKLDREIDRKVREIEQTLAELKRLVANRVAEPSPVSWECFGISGSTVPMKNVVNPFTDVPYESGIRIEKIVPESEAAKMKLNVGDIVVGFDEILTPTHESLVAAVNAAFNGKTRFPKIFVVRDGDVTFARIGER